MAKLIFDSYPSFVKYVKLQKNLTKEETITLLKEYQANPSQENMEELMNGHLPIVLSLVKKYKDTPNVDVMDLILSGLNGLFHAIQNFDFSRNVLFSTYAYKEIESSIREFVRRFSHPVKIPERTVRKYFEIVKTRKMLAEKLQRQPSEAEIVQALDFSITEEELRRMIQSCQTPLSLDRPVDSESDEGQTFQDLLISEDDPKKKLEEDIEEEVIKQRFEQFPSKYRELILERYRPTENGKPVPFEKLSNKDHDTIAQLRYIEDYTKNEIAKYFEKKLNRKL
jgi:RNA polymerase primary sigma factor